MPSLTTNPDGTPHIHTYIRARRPDLTKDPSRYQCADPLCTHSMMKSELYGKLSLCPICRLRTFILNARNLKLSRPCCLECSNSKEAQKHRKTRAALDQFLGVNE